PLTPVMRELVGRAGVVALTGGFAQSLVVEVPAGLDRVRLEVAVRAVMDRHDVLRARLEVVDGVPERLVVPERGTAGVVVQRVDAVGVGGGELVALVRGRVEVEGELLDPVAGRMVRVVWFDRGPGERGRLLFVVHHLVVDGVSWQVLVPDVALAYERPETALDGTGMSFRGWARALTAEAASPGFTAELDFWQEQLRDVWTGPLGARGVGGDVVGGGVWRVEVGVPVGWVSGVLSGVPLAFGVGVDEVLLAGLVGALGEVCGVVGGLLVDVEGHGRVSWSEGVDLSRTVGWFTASFPVRVDVGPVVAGGGVGALLKRVKERVRAVPGDGLGYGLLRYVNPESAAGFEGLPVARVGFNYLGRFSGGGGGGVWGLDTELGLGGTAPAGMGLVHELEAGGVVRDVPGGGSELVLSLVCPVGVMGEVELRGLAGAWVEVLGGLVRHVVEESGGGFT
ncbi:condensation domain-containing protein, partial [Streptomyces sp. NPDC002490]|uniref:condensation domain-containing protein n=1 Tax=Streptomyces sp. NPDC002490 TaxID=3154416 RepID=UPI003327479F